MIPVKLSLRNFMCYRDSTEHLDLTGVHLACLSGENGAGKSALLEAMTWALWGRARDRFIDDELIAKGATDMEVDFQFILNGDLYRVVRKRAMKGKSGQTMLDIQLCQEPGSDNWRTLSGATIRESQTRIGELLKIDYETFVNSAFIMQGRADAFTVKNPAERKQVLADILGLDQYERLEHEAKEEARQRAGIIKDMESLLHRIDQELLLRPGHEDKLKEVEEVLVGKQAALATVRGELAQVQAEEQRLNHSKDRLNEVRDRIFKREHSLDALKVRITRADERQKTLETLLSQREEIEQTYARIRELEMLDEQLNDSKNSLHVLQLEHSRVERDIDGERIKLDSERKLREDNIRRLQQNLQGRATVEMQLAEVLDRLKKLDKVQAQHEDTRCERENLDVRMQTITRERDALAEEGKVIRQKLDMLVEAHGKSKDHVGCPLCGTGLTEDALRRVRESYEQDIADKRREYGEKQRELDDINKRIIAVEGRLSREREELKPLEMYRKREAHLLQQQRSLDEDDKNLGKEEGALVVIKTHLSDGDYAHEARERMQSVVARMKSLSYDEDKHSQVRTQLDELRPLGYESKYHQLESAGTELTNLLQNLGDDRHSLDTMRADQETDRAEELALVPQVEQLEEVKAQRQAKERDEHALAAEVHVLIEERGELKNKLSRCDQLQEEKQRFAAQYHTAVDEQAIYDELARAFGKKGIQAMIIENIIPEVEQEANALLHRMTDGRMSVQFITQKDAKTTKTVIETLDIEIADEVGTRSYEMYSGGEAFRVNFAVRIALSKLLARRAGTQLQTLVIDEGFGSQDGQGREKLVSAIRSIQDDFEKILVITHIEELKDEFPTRINIIKTGSGSKIVPYDES